MSNTEILVVGAGGHARSCIDVIEQLPSFKIAGLIGFPEEIGSEHLGYKVIGSDTDLPSLVSKYEHAMIGLGQIRSPNLRIDMFQKLLNLGFVLPSFVSPNAYVSPHASVGRGSIIMSGGIINAGAKIGQNCIINSNSLVEHDCIVSDHCHVSTGVVINGQVSIGTGCFIGSGATIKQGLDVDKNTVIGMGENVRKQPPMSSQPTT